MHSSTRAQLIRLLFLLATGIALLSACGGNDDEATLEEVDTEPTVAATATPAPTPTAEPTAEPSPTPTPSPVSPLNGMPVESESTTRLMTIKIDNHPNAQPQSGIQHADMMVEIQVEGITRFLAVWQDSNSEFVGPIRSMRPTDFAVQNSWYSSFINSGGQGWVAAIGNASNTEYFVEPAGTFRISGRSAPHNVYGDTNALRQLNTRGDYDAPLDPLWNFGDLPADAPAATAITTNWRAGYQVNWAWNGEAYERSTYDTPHNYRDEDNVDQRITADTLVMLETVVYTAGSGARAVPASETTGSGAAWVFADGKMSKGTWARATDTEWFVLTAEDGTEMTVPPGELWLVLANAGGVVAN